MRYAILSDVHANEPALRAVLADAADMRADRIVCLGDVLGYGPDPVAALELAYRRFHVCLAGNHDDAVSGRMPTDDFTDFAAAAVRRHRAALGRRAIDWLRRLPHVCAFPSPGGAPDGAFACAHGDFADPKNFTYVLDPADAAPSWRERPEPLLFVGHTHRPAVFAQTPDGAVRALPPQDFTLAAGVRYVVNPGSVGYPRSGDGRSVYCLYDDATRTVVFRSLPFDLDGYRERMHGQGLDEAPWMRARAAAHSPADVRTAAAFAAPHKKRGGTQFIASASPSPTPPKQVGGTQFIASTSPSPTPPKQRGGTQFIASITSAAPALVLGAMVLSAALVWCAFRLSDSLRETRRTAQALSHLPGGTQFIASPPSPPSPHPSASPSPPSSAAAPDALALCDGWAVVPGAPDVQTVKIERNARRNETAFRIASASPAPIVFTKTVSLFARPERLDGAVALLTTFRPGAKPAFRFAVRVTFKDGAGATVEETAGEGRRSWKRMLDVPPGAETAEVRVECRCQGTFDLGVPKFRPAR